MRRIGRALALVFLSCPTLSAQPADAAKDRAAALVSQMTLQEKVSQMRNDAPAIPRLNIPAYEWWNESLHGVARAGLATVFPQAIGLAATWDVPFMARVAGAISTEARFKYSREGGRYRGLTFWSPNINIFRDPRWGRGQETFGEDPFLTGRMAAAYVRGMQGSDPLRLKTIATPKHFAVHSGPEALRHTFNAELDEATLRDTYLAAFRTVVEGGAASVMCAYNAVNGEPACASHDLLTRRLRQEWGFDGYVVSDCGAIGDIFKGHKKADSLTEAAAMAVKAGTDLACGDEFDTLVEAVEAGLIDEARIDQAVRRLFTARFRLGMFDDEATAAVVPSVDSPAHRELALEAARRSIVLLSNNGVLPFDDTVKRIAVIGPASDDPTSQLANYSGVPSRIVTPLEGIRDLFEGTTQIRWALGSTYTSATASLMPPDAFPAGLKAQYYANASLSGEPALERTESRVYLNWDMLEPAVSLAVPRSEFSVRWTGVLRVAHDGEYSIGAARAECHDCVALDEVTIVIDGEPVITRDTPAAHPRRTQLFKVPLAAGRDYEIQIEYRQKRGGTGLELVWIPPAAGLLAQARELAAWADVICLFAGLNSDLEGEESDLSIPGFERGDRTTLALPAPQQLLAQQLFDSGKPVVLVLQTGSAVTLAEDANRSAATLVSWYSGQAGGQAIAETLAGVNNPAGRLPVTFYRSDAQLPPFEDYSMRQRTHRYFTGVPWYPFGHGLSYSTFEYSNAQASPAGESGCLLSVDLTNTSARDGEEVVQLYRVAEVPGDGPIQDLVAFDRIRVAAGETATAVFDVEEYDTGWYRVGAGIAQLRCSR